MNAVGIQCGGPGGGGEKKRADALGSAPDDTALVDAPIQLHHNLARPVVVDVHSNSLM